VQRILLEIARVARVVFVPEFMTSKKCAACQRCGEDKSRDYLRIDSKTRMGKCPHCKHEVDRDVNTAANIRNVVHQWMLDGTHPR
jgi:transposase